jgi:carbonic anhydrase
MHCGPECLGQTHGREGDLVEHAVRLNILRVVGQLHSSEPILAQAIRDGRLSIMGARYGMDDGRVSVVG